MKLSELHEIWSLDADIDKSNLDEAARRVPNLHARWMKFYTDERRVYRQIKSQYDGLYRDKFEYYTNRMTDERLRELGWEPNGRKVMSTDVKTYIDADADIIKIKDQLDLQETKMKFLEDVIKQINNRNFILKTMVDFLRFTRGE